MNKYVCFLSVLLCSNLMINGASAEGSRSFDITLVNNAKSDILLERSTWSLGKYVAEDYTIPEHFAGSFNVSTPGETQGSLAFTYITGNTACKFEAGYKLERVFGLLFPSMEVLPWSKATSVGRFGAKCTASIVEKKSADGYVLELSIR